MACPYTQETAVRLSDIDRNGHVNHPVYAEYLGETRAAYYRDVIGVEMERLDTVIVHLEVDYVHPITYGDTVCVSLSVSDIGRSSLTMEYELTVEGTTAATARTVQVLTDGNGEACRIPDDWREAVRASERAANGTE